MNFNLMRSIAAVPDCWTTNKVSSAVAIYKYV
jgi:hypothetical protein